MKPASPVTSTIYCILQINQGCTRQCLVVVLLVSIHLEVIQILFGQLKWFNQTTVWHKKNEETIVKRVPAKRKNDKKRLCDVGDDDDDNCVGDNDTHKHALHKNDLHEGFWFLHTHNHLHANVFTHTNCSHRFCCTQMFPSAGFFYTRKRFTLKYFSQGHFYTHKFYTHRNFHAQKVFYTEIFLSFWLLCTQGVLHTKSLYQ